jgi:lysophospholipase L1-like esterase
MGANVKLLALLILCGMLHAQTLTHWNAAKARVAANGGNAKILCLGDSTTRGYGATGGPQAYPAQLAGFLTTIGSVNSNYSSWYGGDQGTAFIEDSRVVVGSGWTAGTAISIGGKMMTASSATASLSFTPNTSIDTFTFYHQANTGNGTLSYQVDSGAVTNLNDNGTAAAPKVTISGLTAGTHTIKFNWVSGGSVFVIGVESWNSAVSSVDVINAGWGGSTTASWLASTTNPWDLINMFAPIAPDLILLDMGINDWSTGVPVGTYTTQMQTILNAAIASGADVVIVTPIPQIVSITPQNTQQSFVNAMITLGSTNTLLVINEFIQVGTWVAGNALGLYFDGTHPNDPGYARFAKSVESALAPLATVSGKVTFSGQVTIH